MTPSNNNLTNNNNNQNNKNTSSSSKSIVTNSEKETRENSEVEDFDNPKAKHKKQNFEKTRKLRDEVVFTLNMLLTFSACALIFSKPTWFIKLNSLVVTVQMLHRIYEFSCYKWQFYLVDFCYVVNLSVIVFSEFARESAFLFLASFAFSLGPIMLAIFVYKWGFVFHNTVKFTSLWTHFAPGIAMFLHRWCDASAFALANEIAYGKGKLFLHYAEAADFANFSLINLNGVQAYFFSALKLYLPWFLVYYVFMFHVFFKFNIEHGYETQYNYLMQNKKDRKHMLIFGEKLTGVAFMFLHLRYVFFTLIASLLMIYSFYFGLLVILACFVSSVWVTATYYVEYFSEKYKMQFSTESGLKKATPV